MDKDEAKVRDLIYDVTKVQIGDCTDPQVVKALGSNNFDLIFVCIGTNFQSSLEITSLVKEMGGKYVISKANRDVHAKFLLRNGADEVIYPDRDVAVNLAERCTAHNVYDYISISDEYSIYEISIVPSWVGKSLKEIDVRAVYNVNVIAIIQSDGNVMVMPKVDYALQEADHVKIIGSKEDVAKLLKEIPEKA